MIYQNIVKRRNEIRTHSGNQGQIFSICQDNNISSGKLDQGHSVNSPDYLRYYDLLTFYFVDLTSKSGTNEE